MFGEVVVQLDGLFPSVVVGRGLGEVLQQALAVNDLVEVALQCRPAGDDLGVDDEVAGSLDLRVVVVEGARRSKRRW
ncbi:hypothetical protein [Micromonospora sp. CPCC 206061]|uniref:hypothetical protein n=1 Tax=Micromonospora sp. CPCC 206061 TaxID=3122410 RepID=UPI002FF35909